ncbi:hypothetical protein HUG17_9995 [Dermatophagoides farinae]|uniref:Beta-lactamase-related domain-containing protein n=1 Tax=Dermatophagoides farinae TaxID=6954 RepID=A0A9D4P2Q3_DERFA|nr:serine beta-lactamase-like protein LACTB, mitochondrial [Dermatophagoides farinae]KAH7643304.1 hypothetical protein HUG17_9995 [Dermatophagoides farinae]
MNSGRSWKTLGWFTLGSLSTYGFLNQYPDYLTILKHKNVNVDDDKFTGTDERSKKVLITTENNQIVETRSYEQAINKSRQRLLQWKIEQTIPGFVIGVSVRGKNVWIEGQGLADIENNIPCHSNTVMRIASISKSITATMLAKMVEDNKINLDHSIYDYLVDGQFPKKTWENQPVDITLRQLASHLGGIRHYKEEEEKENKNGEKRKSNEFECKEYYLKEHFPNVTESLSLFKDDPLVAKPGTKFHYSTFGYTLIAAIMETKMESKNFAKDLMKFIHNELGLRHTRLDQNDVIIYDRSRYYYRDKNSGKILNVPYVDNSYKWAGGGLLSNIPDLLQYGNLMLYSYHGIDHNGRIGYLHKSTVEEMWKPMDNSSTKWSVDKSKGYGIGFSVIQNGQNQNRHAFASEPLFDNVAMHSGGAIGASSILVIEPDNEIVVAIIANLQEANEISKMGMEIGKIFSTA